MDVNKLKTFAKINQFLSSSFRGKPQPLKAYFHLSPHLNCRQYCFVKIWPKVFGTKIGFEGKIWH